MLEVRAVLLATIPLVLGSAFGERHGSGPPSHLQYSDQGEEYRLLTIRGIVWQVFSTSHLQRLTLPGAEQERLAGDIERGTTEPVSSPDQRYVAYTRALDVWLYDVAADTAHKLTRLALPGNATTAAAFLWIAGWSATGTRLLVYLDHDEVEDPEGYRANLVVQPADYGYYSCDWKLSACTKVTLPGAFQAWLPDGEYLLTTDEPVPTNRRLVRYDAQSGTTVPFASDTDWLLQLDVARSGDRALAVVARGTDASWVITLDLRSGVLTPLTPPGSFGEYNWPRYSPSTQRVAYVRISRARETIAGVPRTPAVVQGTVIVDGKAVYRCKSLYVQCKAHWITERVVAAEETDIVLEEGVLRSSTRFLAVLDAETGQVKAVDTLEVERPAVRR